MSDYEEGYSDGRAGRGVAVITSWEREEYMRGYDLGNEDRREFGEAR